MTRLLLAIAAAFTLSVASAFAAPNVVVSIKPVHSLVAAIMQGVGEPDVLVGGNASPHTYQLKPSQAASLQQADVIFWTGQDLEAFLEKPLENLAGKATVVELDKAEGLTLLKPREGGAFEPHDDEQATSHDHGAEVDMHFWLDTKNAKAMARAITQVLAAADPANANRYRDNLAQLDGRLDELALSLHAKLEPVKSRPFIVFHDAYQYFEREFGLTIAGSVTVNPDMSPGAERLAAIQTKIKDSRAACIFAEPQFEPRLVTMLADGTSARIGALDPEAGSIPEGPELYFTMMTALGDNIANCLSGQ